MDSQKKQNRIRIPVSPAVFKLHRKVSKWKSAALIAALHAAAVCLVVVGGSFSNWMLAPLCFVLIAGIQMHLSILLHEGAHYLLHPNKKTNEILAELCGMPLLFPAKNYRALHLAHHEHSGSPDKDPEKRIYRESQDYTYTPHKKWSQVFKMFAKDLLFVNAIRFFVSVDKYLRSIPGFKIITPVEILRYALIVGLPVAMSIYFGVWLELLLLWFLPLLTLSFFLLKLHIYGEHTGKEGPTEFDRTWHHQSHPVLDFFVYPIRSGFHLEHHLYPSVPWYNMKSFHLELMQVSEWKEAQQNLNSDGYFSGRNTILYGMLKESDGNKAKAQMAE